MLEMSDQEDIELKDLDLEEVEEDEMSHNEAEDITEDELEDLQTPDDEKQPNSPGQKFVDFFLIGFFKLKN
jgi:hypothetical protein